MPENACEEIRRSLALGETEGIGGHLATCETCRREAELLELVAATLQEDAVRTPPERLDRLVRGRIAGAPVPVFGTVGIALAALLALVCGAGALLAERGLAERGVLTAAVVVAIYLAVSAAATLPILIGRGSAAPSEGRG